MARVAMTAERWAAGTRYIESLRALGLSPDVAMWIYDREADEFKLLLGTDLVDFAGPAAVYALLHKAFYLKGTPTEFNPWIVELADKKHDLFGIIYESIESPDPPQKIYSLGSDGITYEQDLAAIHIQFLTFEFEPGWVYFREERTASEQVDKKWRAFEHNVDALAA